MFNFQSSNDAAVIPYPNKVIINFKFQISNFKVKKGVYNNTFHPYVGITRIRFEGIISARNSRHPLNCGCKGTIIWRNGQIIKVEN